MTAKCSLQSALHILIAIVFPPNVTSCFPTHSLRVGTVNVGTLKGDVLIFAVSKKFGGMELQPSSSLARGIGVNCSGLATVIE